MKNKVKIIGRNKEGCYTINGTPLRSVTSAVPVVESSVIAESNSVSVKYYPFPPEVFTQIESFIGEGEVLVCP